MKRDRRVFPCPHCGEPVPEDARSCPHCGSDAETGWDPDAEYDSIELPEEDGDAEAPGAERPGISGAFMALLMLVAALAIVVAGGLLGLAASLFTLLGVLVVIAFIAQRMRRPRRGPPVR